MAEFKAKTAAEMRKLAEAVIAAEEAYLAPTGGRAEWRRLRKADADFRAEIEAPQIIHDANLIEAQAKRIDELSMALAKVVAALKSPSQTIRDAETIEAQARRIEELAASLRQCVVLLEEVGDGSCGPHCHQEDGFDFSAEIAEANALLSTPGAS